MEAPFERLILWPRPEARCGHGDESIPAMPTRATGVSIVKKRLFNHALSDAFAWCYGSKVDTE
jgi:hypothetical protein